MTQGSWVNADYSGCVSCVYVCVTFIELGVLWKPRCPEPITSLLSLNLWKAKKKHKKKSRGMLNTHINIPTIWTFWKLFCVLKWARISHDFCGGKCHIIKFTTGSLREFQWTDVSDVANLIIIICSLEKKAY